MVIDGVGLKPVAEKPGNPVHMGGSLGLPPATVACLFDLDGVLTATAKLHAAAWKEMFDGYLKGRADRFGTEFVAFDAVADYATFVDGKSRADGTRSFLQSRGIELPLGGPGDRAGVATITGLGDAKNARLIRRIRRDGVEPFPGSVRYVQAVRSAGLQMAVVSPARTAPRCSAPRVSRTCSRCASTGSPSTSST